MSTTYNFQHHPSGVSFQQAAEMLPYYYGRVLESIWNKNYAQAAQRLTEAMHVHSGPPDILQGFAYPLSRLSAKIEHAERNSPAALLLEAISRRSGMLLLALANRLQHDTTCPEC